VALKQALEREAGEEAWLIKTETEKEELVSTLEARVETLRNMDRLLYCDHALNLKGIWLTGANNWIIRYLLCKLWLNQDA